MSEDPLDQLSDTFGTELYLWVHFHKLPSINRGPCWDFTSPGITQVSYLTVLEKCVHSLTSSTELSWKMTTRPFGEESGWYLQHVFPVALRDPPSGSLASHHPGASMNGLRSGNHTRESHLFLLWWLLSPFYWQALNLLFIIQVKIHHKVDW